MSDDNYTNFDEFDPGGYDNAGYEGDASSGLPDGHWATDQSWLQWMDQFASQLQADEQLLERFNEFLGSMGSEHGEQAGVEHDPGASEAPKFSRLTDPALREHALGLVRKAREAK